MILLFRKYIKSATYNTAISERTERILLLCFFTIWIIALIPTLIYIIQGFYSVPLYFKSVELKRKYQTTLTNNRKNQENQESIRNAIKQSESNKKTPIFKFIDSINRGVENKKPVIAADFQESAKRDNISQEISFDLKSFRDVGIDNPDPNDDSMPDKAIAINLSNIIEALFCFLYYVLLFAIPWLCIRAFFWIRTGSPTSQIT